MKKDKKKRLSRIYVKKKKGEKNCHKKKNFSFLFALFLSLFFQVKN